MLPSINPEHYFGGIHTAVELYRALSARCERSRIVLMDSVPREEARARFPDHVLVDANETSDAPRQIVAFSDRYGRTLPVGAGDRWLATAWWTAYAAQRLTQWQAEQFGTDAGIGYLIQDFEPGFYPWSSQYALAMSTYRPDRDVAVFNTGLLADYMAKQGFSFRKQLTFEPTLNSAMRPALEAARTAHQSRKRRIVVYARPSTPRNAFEVLCEGLRVWGWSDPHSSNWEVVAPGELKSDLDLGPFKMRALGKLDIHRYAELLSTSAIGMSLMISPHPSYPPLEMAAFGMGVITNAYMNKDLSAWSPNIRSVQVMSPENLASNLRDECAIWGGRDMLPGSLVAPDHAFLGELGFGQIAAQLDHWLF